MNYFTSMPGFYKLLRGANAFKKNRKIIDKARAEGNFEEERKYILDSTSTFGPMIFKEFGSTIEIKGAENIPDKGPAVIMSNHQGYADIAALMVAFNKFQFGFVAKQELKKIPVYGEWIEKIRSVFIERDDPREALRAINRGVELIEQGFSLAIFPEGTRSKGPDPGPFQHAAIKLATKPGVPLIPVSIEGTYKMFEENGKPNAAKVGLMVHKPIETKGLDRDEVKKLSVEVEEIIVNGVKELQGEMYG